MDDIPMERIVELKPDLIMATWAGIDEDTYNKLSEIAPTVAQHPDYEDWETPWDARTIRIGQVFGKEQEAQEIIDGIAERIKQIAADHPEWSEMEAVTVTTGDGEISVATEGHSRGKLMVDLGFKLPREIVDAADGGITAAFSVEQMQIVDRDLLVWVNGSDDPGPIVDLPLRTTLNAHTEGREVYCDKVLTAAFSIQSPLSYGYLLDVIVPEIELAVDGDPSTVVTIAAQNGIAP